MTVSITIGSPRAAECVHADPLPWRGANRHTQADGTIRR
jgi:hypothetical protein